MILHNYNDIPSIIKKEGMSLWLCSHGGCGTHMLSHYLENKGFIIRTSSWRRILVHCPVYIPVECKVIYLYSNNIELSLLSQKRRNLNIKNYKRLTNGETDYSDIKMIQVMKQQRDNWLSTSVLKLCYENLWENLDILSKYLDIDVSNFPKKMERYKIIDNG